MGGQSRFVEMQLAPFSPFLNPQLVPALSSASPESSRIVCLLYKLLEDAYVSGNPCTVVIDPSSGLALTFDPLPIVADRRPRAELRRVYLRPLLKLVMSGLWVEVFDLSDPLWRPALSIAGKLL